MNESIAVNTLMEDEPRLLARVLAGDAHALRELATRYARPIYSYVLNLSGCAHDAAYEATAELLSDRLAARRPDQEEWFFVDCLKSAVQAARALPVRALFDTASGETASPERAASRRFLREALGRLSFDDKSFLLLRDQLCLPYAVIGRVHGLPERDARVRIERARLALRESLEKILRHREGA